MLDLSQGGGHQTAAAEEDRPRPTEIGTGGLGVPTAVEADGGGRSRRATGKIGRDRMTVEIGRGLTTGGMTVRSRMTEGMIDQGPMREGTTIETNGQHDRILEGCLRARRPAGIQSKTAGTRLAELEAIELLRPRRRTATTVPSAMPADRSQSLSAEDR